MTGSTIAVTWSVDHPATLVVDFREDTLPPDLPVCLISNDLYVAWRSAELTYKALSSKLHDVLLDAENRAQS